MIFTSPNPPADVPDLPLTWYVLGNAERYGDRVAIVDVAGERQYTYAELAQTVRNVSAGLRARGFGHGDVLAMLAPNLPEYPIVYHAAVLAGGTVVLLNPLDTADDLTGHLNQAGAGWLVTVPSEVDKVRELTGRTGVEEIIVLGEADGTVPFAELAAFSGDAPAEPVIDPAQDVATILHSSGSTGSPKGVRLTHRNLVSSALQTSLIAASAEDEKVLAVPPFHHAFGVSMVMNAGLRQGTTLVTMPRFEPEAFLRAIQDHGITRLYAVPTMIVLLAKSPLVDQYDLSSLRYIVSGGAALDPEVGALCEQRLGCQVGQGYGLTEGLPTFMQLDGASPGSVGHPAPGIECKIVDPETGEELDANRNGEILYRGPHLMKGYLNAADATAEAFDADGFLRTGDLGYVDDNGELFIVDRLKELIKYKGQQVSPAELEAVLMAHPKVADAAVIGVPDEDATELPKGFVVTKEPVTAEELMAFVAGQVAPYKKIRRVEFIDRIPRTPVGKIERRSLKEREHAGSH